MASASPSFVLQVVRILLMGSLLTGGTDPAEPGGRSPFALPDRVGISAHRASSGEAPENTLAALRAVLKQSVEYVEIDVRTTKDGQLVILHDATLNRTTTGTGPLNDYTLADLRKLSIRGPAGESYGTERIPTLAEVAQQLARWNQRHPKPTNLYVDCKDVKPEPLVAVLRRYGLLNDAVFYGSDARLLALRRVAPHAKLMPGLKSTDQLTERIERLHPYAFDVGWPLPDDALVPTIHQRGIRVFTDLLDENDTPEQYVKAARLGVDVIQTDHVRRVQQMLPVGNSSIIHSAHTNQQP